VDRFRLGRLHIHNESRGVVDFLAWKKTDRQPGSSSLACRLHEWVSHNVFWFEVGPLLTLLKSAVKLGFASSAFRNSAAACALSFLRPKTRLKL
jgi:hypothetical protein